MIDHGMSLINDTLHVNIPDDPEVNKIIYNGVEFVPGQQWIPCSERLPEENNKCYFALGNNGYVGAIFYYKGIWNATSYVCKYAFEDGFIIAWMPIPELEKEEEDGCVHQ